MIDETPGASPEETAAPATAPETTSPAGSEPPSSPEPAVAAQPDESVATSDDALRQAVADGEQPLVHGADQVAEQIAHDQAQGFHGQEAGEPTPENPEGSDAQ